jgi:hypothetical protein
VAHLEGTGDARLLTRLAVPMEGALMCRVIARLAAMFFREAASRPSLRRFVSAPSRIRSALQRRLRIVRHRALRWFGEPIAIIERKRRDRDLDPSVGRYDFQPRPARHYARLERATSNATAAWRTGGA